MAPHGALSMISNTSTFLVAFFQSDRTGQRFCLLKSTGASRRRLCYLWVNGPRSTILWVNGPGSRLGEKLHPLPVSGTSAF